MPNMTMVQAINNALALEMERDPQVILCGEDIGANGGVFRVTDQLQERFGEERVVDTPLAESGIIGTALGMALYGLHPVVELQFAGFSFLAFNQIASQVTRMRYRSGGVFTAPIVIRAPFGGGVRTPELHSDNLEAFFMHMQGIKAGSSDSSTTSSITSSTTGLSFFAGRCFFISVVFSSINLMKSGSSFLLSGL
jgi:pyruvate dehydrogenase E1 component beta subunit